VGSMTAAVLRLLALIALVLMPLGMAGAPAAASAMPADHAMAAGHCEGQPGDEQQAPSASMDCAAMCTAIPAREAEAPIPMFQRSNLAAVTVAVAFQGIEPELATPPPRA
jgi:hypothetical protein